MRVDGEGATCGHSQTLEAVNLIRRHVDKHGVVATTKALKLLRHWVSQNRQTTL